MSSNFPSGSSRLCDIVLNNIVIPNNADVYAVTDTTDFFFEGKQHFSSRNIEITNNDTFRLYRSGLIVDDCQAKIILDRELNAIFGSRLKALKISSPTDVSDDPKVALLDAIDGKGSTPRMIVQQYKKIKTCYELLLDNEKTNGQYDIIIRSRFDNKFTSGCLDLKCYDFNLNQVYVPGVKGPIVYDWYAFGKRDAMHLLLNLYNNLGFIQEKTFMFECRQCGKCIAHGNSIDGKHVCRNCGSAEKVFPYDITIASEHHIYRTLKDNNIPFSDAHFGVTIQRYRESNDEDSLSAIQKLNLGVVNLINHSEKSCNSREIL